MLQVVGLERLRQNVFHYLNKIWQITNARFDKSNYIEICVVLYSEKKADIPFAYKKIIKKIKRKKFCALNMYRWVKR